MLLEIKSIINRAVLKVAITRSVVKPTPNTPSLLHTCSRNDVAVWVSQKPEDLKHKSMDFTTVNEYELSTEKNMNK